MLDAMIRTEESAGSVFNDIFLPFLGANAGAGGWIKRQGDELRERLRSVADELDASGVPPDLWEKDHGVSTLPDLMRYALAISAALPKLSGRTVLCFSPSSMADETAFTLALSKAVQEGLPENIILMAWGYPGSFISDHLAAREDLGVRTITPKLNMANAANEILETGDPTSLPVRFQKLFMRLSEHGNRGAMDLLRKEGQEAVEIAQQIPGWEHMVATVLITVGSLLLSRKADKREALEYFERARVQAEVARNAGSPNADAVLMQSFTFEALGLFHLNDYAQAANRYEAAAAVTEEEAYAYNRFEALRMATFCHLQDRDYAAAWPVALRALDEAETLTPELAANSTVPFLGRDLLSLVEHRNQGSRESEIRSRLAALAGEDWEAKLAEMENNWRKR